MKDIIPPELQETYGQLIVNPAFKQILAICEKEFGPTTTRWTPDKPVPETQAAWEGGQVEGFLTAISFFKGDL